jgi:hypothetical protein
MKITLDISEREIALLDELARASGISRDEVVANILIEDIERHKKLKEAKNLSDEKSESVG